jgi:hypothetical protein
MGCVLALLSLVARLAGLASRPMARAMAGGFGRDSTQGCSGSETGSAGFLAMLCAPSRLMDPIAGFPENADTIPPLTQRRLVHPRRSLESEDMPGVGAWSRFRSSIQGFCQIGPWPDVISPIQVIAATAWEIRVGMVSMAICLMATPSMPASSARAYKNEPRPRQWREQGSRTARFFYSSDPAFAYALHRAEHRRSRY